MRKVIKNGKVAVLYSPGYGAGWFSWNEEYPEIVFDPVIVQYVEDKKLDELSTYMAMTYPDAYLGGMESLEVRWVDQGTLFRINEYDGSERIEVKENMEWLIA